MLIVNDQTPYKTLKEFTDDAMKRPNEIIFSSSGLYGALHLPMALYHQSGGHQAAPLADQWRRPGAHRADRQQLPGAGLLDRRLHRPDQGRKARALASFGAQRSHALPDVPTMKELGYDLEFYLWVGLFAPKGTPAPIVDKIRTFTREAVMTPKFKELMANIGQDVDYMDQAEFKAFWDADAKRVEDAVHSSAASRGEAFLPSRVVSGEGKVGSVERSELKKEPHPDPPRRRGGMMGSCWLGDQAWRRERKTPPCPPRTGRDETMTLRADHWRAARPLRRQWRCSR